MPTKQKLEDTLDKRWGTLGQEDKKQALNAIATVGNIDEFVERLKVYNFSSDKSKDDQASPAQREAASKWLSENEQKLTSGEKKLAEELRRDFAWKEEDKIEPKMREYHAAQLKMKEDARKAEEANRKTADAEANKKADRKAADAKKAEDQDFLRDFVVIDQAELDAAAKHPQYKPQQSRVSKALSSLVNRLTRNSEVNKGNRASTPSDTGVSPKDKGKDQGRFQIISTFFNSLLNYEIQNSI